MTLPPMKTFLLVALIAVVISIAGILLLRTMESASPSPMEELTLAHCDLDADGKCDVADQVLFQQALGTKRGDLNYNPLADADADGVVMAIDQHILFPVTSPMPQPQVFDTSMWQTYRSDEFGFEVRYPSQDQDFGIPVKVIPDEPSLEVYLQEFNESRTAEHVEFDPVVILKKGDTQVGPYEAIQYETVQGAVPSVSIETYFQMENGTIIRIASWHIDEYKITEQMRQLHDQILSTFRFVE